MTPRGQLKQRMKVGQAPPPTPPRPTEAGSDASSFKPEPEPRIPAYAGIFMVAIVTFLYLFYIARQKAKWNPETIWVAEDLALFNGTDPNIPLLISITGSVFDVTKGAKHYGKGQAYNHFCGRDATRAFVSGNFTGDGLSDNVVGLTYEQLHSLEEWRGFYLKTYPHVGKLVGRFYDANGSPTKVLASLLRRFQRAQLEVARGKAEDAKYPHCSSRWAADTGGEVWCDSGYPRKFFKGGGAAGGERAPQTRCACIEEGQLGLATLQEYPNCPSRAQRCVTVPPQGAHSR